MNDERFKDRAIFHAMRQPVPVPVALLRHYHDLGLRPQHVVFVLEIFAAYMNGEEASQTKIAERMQTDPRIVRRYSAHLRKLGLLVVTTRHEDRARVENDYDFTPLLDAVEVAMNSSPH